MASTIRSTYPRGPKSKIKPLERRAIQLAYLTQGMTKRVIATQFGRSEQVVYRVLSGPDFDEVRRELTEGTRDQAKLMLERAMPEAVTQWLRAMPTAADKGDHRPAKDLLLHTKLIDPLVDHPAPPPAVMICIGMPGRPAVVPPTQDQIDAARAARLLREANPDDPSA